MPNASDIAPTAPIAPTAVGRGSWPLVGAAVAAVAASSCCLLPLLGAAFGVSLLGGAGHALGSARPLFLLAATVMMFVGGRSILARVGAAADADSCGCAGERSAARKRRSVLLVAVAAVVVAALAFVPEWLVAGAAR